jgi:imidazolonepropionase-like amidohydrolase
MKIMTMNKFLSHIILLCLIGIQSINAQKTAFIGGEIHVGNGVVISGGTLLINDGIIQDILINPMQDQLMGYNLISVSDKRIYPGIIAPATQIGLVEVESVSATVDFREVGSYNPNVRTLVAYNTDSRITPTLLSNGITTVQSSPKGGVISGTSSIFKTTGWNWEDAVIKEDDGIFINWSENYFLTGWWAGVQENKKNEKYADFKNQLTDFITLSKSYCEEKGSQQDLKHEAMCGLFNNTQKAFVKVNGAYEIIDAVQTLQKLDIQNMVIVGGRDAYQIVDFLKEKSVPIIVQYVHNLPRQRHDEVDINYKSPKILQDAGVLFCFGLEGAWEQRNLPFIAGTAAGFGLSEQEALSAITHNAAKILGINEKVGTIEKGKIANILISKGDILDMKSSIVEKVFIEGKEIDINDHQKMNYQKYLEKYNIGN